MKKGKWAATLRRKCLATRCERDWESDTRTPRGREACDYRIVGVVDDTRLR